MLSNRFKKGEKERKQSFQSGASGGGPGGTPAQQAQAGSPAPASSPAPAAAKNGGGDRGSSRLSLTTPTERRSSIQKGGRADELKEYSPYAVALGLIRPQKWGTDTFGWDGAMTDRTHGHIGRPTVSLRERKSAKGGTKGKAADTASRTSSAALRGKFGNYTPAPNVELDADPLPPAPSRHLPDFSGTWLCSSTAGHWDAFLTMNGVEPYKIALARGTDFGARHAVQKIEMPQNHAQIMISTRGAHCARTPNFFGKPTAPPHAFSNLQTPPLPSPLSQPTPTSVSSTRR